MKANNIFLYTALFLTFLLQCMISNAQAPQKISYQSVIRNANGELIRSSAVRIQISILKGSATGTVMYQELQSKITNINGLVTLEVGKGTPITSTFSAINWSQGPYFLKIETNFSNTNSYDVTGISEILSVPYSLYAKKAEKADSVINEKDPIFNASVAKKITAADTIRWNSSLSNYNEIDPIYAIDSSYIKIGTRSWNSSLAKTIDTADTTRWGKAEADPLFSTWNKSTGITITESQISNLHHFTNSDETDPRYAADSSYIKSGVRNWNSSLAKTIDATDTTHWGQAETDPVFGSWNRSTGISITESQISNLHHFTNSDETDPRYAADSSFIKSGVRNWNSSLAKTIDATDTTHWGQAETDPVFGSWNRSTGISITESQISNLQHFTNTDEIDPRYATDSSFIKSGVRNWNSSLAKTIDATDTTHWGQAETDPVFGAWNRSTGISITESQISDLQHFTNTDEIDPRYATDSSFIKSGVRNWNSSLAKTIDAVDTTHWGRAETDPLFTSSAASLITNAGSGIVISAAERTKLIGIAEGAEVNVQADWNQATSTADDYIKNKPNFDTSVNFSGSLSGDVTGTQGATVVSSVGGQSSANVVSATVLANAATSTNTAGTIVRRDASGNFSANIISSNLNGNVTGNLTGIATSATTATTATNFSGSMSGDVTGTQSATVVSSVGGQSSANVATGTVLANEATSTNTTNTIVKRDGSGNFAAGTITASGLTVTGGTPGAGKVLTSDASGNATWQTGGGSSTVTEITRSRFQLTDIAGAYILNGMSLAENNDITDYRNHFIAPFNGKLVKIVVKSEVAMGNTDLRIHINKNTTALEIQTVNIAAANTAYTFTFTSAATFSTGDDIELYIDPTSLGASTSSKVSFSIVWQY